MSSVERRRRGSPPTHARSQTSASPVAAGTPWVLLPAWAFLAGAIPLCLLLGVKGVAPAIGVAGLLCPSWGRPGRGMLAPALLVLWATLSIAWSPAPNLHAPNGVGALGRVPILYLIAELALCGAFVTASARLDRAQASKALGWIATGVLLTLPLLIEEALSQSRGRLALVALAHQSFRADRTIANLAQASYLVAVLAWPVGAALHRQGRPRLALAPAAFVPLSMILLRGVAPTLGLLLSLPVFALVRWRGRPATAVLAAATAIYLLATPLVMFAGAHLGLYARYRSALPPSWADRLRIWSLFADRLAASPWRGAGFDASRALRGVALHPHDAPLQLWYELGVPGVALGALFWLWLWRRIGVGAERDRIYGAVAAATTTVYLTIGAVSFGLWEEWWICTGALAMGLCVLLRGTLQHPASGVGPSP